MRSAGVLIVFIFLAVAVVPASALCDDKCMTCTVNTTICTQCVFPYSLQAETCYDPTDPIACKVFCRYGKCTGGSLCDCDVGFDGVFCQTFKPICVAELTIFTTVSASMMVLLGLFFVVTFTRHHVYLFSREKQAPPELSLSEKIQLHQKRLAIVPNQVVEQVNFCNVVCCLPIRKPTVGFKRFFAREQPALETCYPYSNETIPLSHRWQRFLMISLSAIWFNMIGIFIFSKPSLQGRTNLPNLPYAVANGVISYFAKQLFWGFVTMIMKGCAPTVRSRRPGLDYFYLFITVLGAAGTWVTLGYMLRLFPCDYFFAYFFIGWGITEGLDWSIFALVRTCFKYAFAKCWKYDDDPSTYRARKRKAAALRKSGEDPNADPANLIESDLYNISIASFKGTKKSDSAAGVSPAPAPAPAPTGPPAPSPYAASAQYERRPTIGGGTPFAESPAAAAGASGSGSGQAKANQDADTSSTALLKKGGGSSSLSGSSSSN